jgi:hypothetical protein
LLVDSEASMIGSRSMVALSALAFSLAGCGGNVVVDAQTSGASGAGGGVGADGGTGKTNPLVGSWKGAAGGPTRLGETLTINADGTAAATDTFIVVGDGFTTCTGALQITDNWTSTSTTFSVSGGTCTGSVACPNGDTIPCGPAETAAQTCTYALSNANNTLVLTCPQGNGPITYTRQ